MSIRGRALRLSTLLCLLVASSLALPADKPWRTLSTPQYELLSQLNDRETQAWAREFDQFIATMTRLLGVQPSALPPLTVILFSRDRDFTAYKLRRPDGTTANVAGQFVRQPTWSTIGLVYDSDSESLRQTIFHEATHWLMSADEGRQPAWFSEGIAELLSTFGRQGGNVHWARPLQHHLELLAQVPTVPLAQFLIEPGALFNRDDHTDRFYAQSWAFTHFLMYSGDADRVRLLGRFVETFKSNSGEATVDAVFGAQLPAIEREFQSYLQQPTFSYTAQPAVDVPAPPPLEAAKPAQVESALGFLALGSDRHDLARRHATAAIALDATHAGGHEILAYLALHDEAAADVARHAEAALRNGSRDSDMYLMMGNSYIRGPDRARPEAARQRADLYGSAIRLNPRRMLPYSLLADAVMNLQDPAEEDARLLAQGIAAWPGDDWLRLGAAMIDQRMGRSEAARTGIERALREGSTLDAAQRQYASSVVRSWRLNTLNQEISAAVSRRDLPAARAAFEQQRGGIAGEPQGDAMLAQMDAQLTRMELSESFSDALRERRVEDARAAAAKLLALPDLPQQMRAQLEQILSDLE